MESKAMRNSPGSVSIVIPVYRAAKSIDKLVESLFDELEAGNRVFELVLVDDCSPDDSWEVLKSLKERYPEKIKIARLLNNSGQHNALLCGFSLTSGDVVVTMDDDLQHPPEEVEKLVQAVENGSDVVIGKYDSKQHETYRNLGGMLVDKTIRRIFRLPKTFQLTSFRAVKRQVVERIIETDVTYPYITTLLLSNASSYKNVSVRHDSRPYGKSNYTIKRSLVLALILLFQYSYYPVYFVATIGSLAFLFSAGYGTYTFARALLYDVAVPGWSSTIVFTAFISSQILLASLVLLIYTSMLTRQINRSKVNYTIDEIHE